MYVLLELVRDRGRDGGGGGGDHGHGHDALQRILLLEFPASSHLQHG